MNFTNAQDHEPKAEHNNRTIKEAFQTAFHGTPHSRMPRLMTQELAELTAEHLNHFPAKNGTLKCCSPHVIMNQEPIDCNKHCKCELGGHVQAHHQNDPAHSTTERTIDATHLRPNSNRQGGHRVMNPHTGKPIAQNKVAPVPMTKLVLNQVKKMAKDQGIAEVKFTNKRGMQLPHSDWLAGVDYDNDCFEDEQSDDEDNEDDDECQPPQRIQDIELQTDEDVDMEETEDLLHDEHDQEDDEELSQQDDTESNPITDEDEDMDEEIDESLLDDQDESQQVETVDEDDNEEVEDQPVKEPQQQQH